MKKQRIIIVCILAIISVTAILSSCNNHTGNGNETSPVLSTPEVSTPIPEASKTPPSLSDPDDNNCTISTINNNPDAGTVSGNGEFIEGDTITLTAVPETGFEFSGWYNNDELLSHAKSYTFTATENLTLTAKWHQAKYFVHYTNDMNAGQVAGMEYYYHGSSATVRAFTYMGYKFIGWFKGSELMSSDSFYTFTVTEDVSLTPKWEPLSGLENFYFKSTYDTCTITGLKNFSLTEIVIPECATHIENFAFEDLEFLTSVTIPKSVKNIGYGAFHRCFSLNEIKFAAPSGWKAEGTLFLTSDLKNPTKAAEYLTTKHAFAVWQKP